MAGDLSQGGCSAEVKSKLQPSAACLHSAVCQAIIKGFQDCRGLERVIYECNGGHKGPLRQEKIWKLGSFFATFFWSLFPWPCQNCHFCTQNKVGLQEIQCVIYWLVSWGGWTGVKMKKNMMG